MSWYFFGGFSAYAMVPSALVVNQSGCSFTHGWSGAHCRARSIATSSPLSRAAAMDRRQVQDVEAHLRHGRDAVGRGGERAVHRRALGRGALRAREELVPGGEER